MSLRDMIRIEKKDGRADVCGLLYFYDFEEERWHSKSGFKDIYCESVYAYRPLGE